MNIHKIRMADACIYRQYGDPVSIDLQSCRPNLSFWPAGKYSLKTHHCRRQVLFGGAQLQRDPMIVFSCFCIRDVLVRYVYRRHGIHRYVLLWYILAGVLCKYDSRLFTYVSHIPKGDHLVMDLLRPHLRRPHFTDFRCTAGHGFFPRSFLRSKAVMIWENSRFMICVSKFLLDSRLEVVSVCLDYCCDSFQQHLQQWDCTTG